MGAFVDEWGSFVDETPSSGGHPPSPPPQPDTDDEWGTFEHEPGNGPSSSRLSPPGPTSATDADDGWGVFDPPSTEGISSQSPPSAGVPAPSPEVVASLLTAGETLWAQVDGFVAVLGSGCPVTAVYDGEPDGFSGWRPVTVVDPARLTVRPVPLSLAEPPAGAATSVAELYSDTEPRSAAEPRRAARFPVGQGPDLDAVLDRAVAEERDQVRAEAADAAQRAAVQLNAKKRELAERAELAERQARMREEQAQAEERRTRQEAAQQIAAARAESQQQIAEAREKAAQAVQHWQFQAQQAEAERTRLAGDLDRANRAGVQRLTLVGVLAVIAVVLTFVIKGA
ncbi:hypothetical protein ACWEOP_27895 [Streptomyces chartreusis]